MCFDNQSAIGPSDDSSAALDLLHILVCHISVKLAACDAVDNDLCHIPHPFMSLRVSFSDSASSYQLTSPQHVLIKSDSKPAGS